MFADCCCCWRGAAVVVGKEKSADSSIVNVLCGGGIVAVSDICLAGVCDLCGEIERVVRERLKSD